MYTEETFKNNVYSNNISTLSDSALLVRIFENNDERAYEILIDRYLQPLWRLASNILHDGSEAEDVIQDVFAMLWHRKLDWDSQGDAKFTSWIYRVVLNKCIDVKRKKQRQALSGKDIPES